MRGSGRRRGTSSASSVRRDGAPQSSSSRASSVVPKSSAKGASQRGRGVKRGIGSSGSKAAALSVALTRITEVGDSDEAEADLQKQQPEDEPTICGLCGKKPCQVPWTNTVEVKLPSGQTEVRPSGQCCKACAAMYSENFAGAIGFEDLCREASGPGAWMDRLAACKTVVKSVEHSLEISTPVDVLSAASIRRHLKMASTARIPNLNVPCIELDTFDCGDKEKQTYWLFGRDETKDRVGVLKTSIKFRQDEVLLPQSEHRYDEQSRLYALKALADHRDETGEPQLSKGFKTLREFQASWAKDHNADDAGAFADARGGHAPQGTKRRRLGSLFGPIGVSPRQHSRDPIPVTVSSGSTTQPSIELAALTPQVRLESRGDPHQGQHVEAEEPCDDITGSVSQDEDDVEAWSIAAYKEALNPLAIWQKGALDKRTRIGAIRQSKSGNDEYKDIFKRLLLEADKAEAMLPADIPDTHRGDLDKSIKHFKSKDIKFNLAVQKPLLARRAQDVINSPDWSLLPIILDLLVAGEFDGAAPVLGHLDCTLAQKIKMFKFILFQCCMIPTVQNGGLTSAPMIAMCKRFIEIYDALDLVEAPDALAAELDVWQNTWVGIATLASIEFSHDKADDR
jgi:hypothetical protein